MTVTTVIQARFGSTRFPGKVLADIYGKPLISFLIERLRRSRRAGTVVVATTTLNADDAIADFAAVAGTLVVRGEEDDVLARYMRVLDAHPAEVVVRVTADNPLTDPGMLDAMVEMLSMKELDYIHAPGAAYGAAVDVFSRPALQCCHTEATSERAREHINAHILDNSTDFNVGVFEPAPELRRPDVRLSVDTPADLERVRALIEPLTDPVNAPLNEVIRLAGQASG